MAAFWFDLGEKIEFLDTGEAFIIESRFQGGFGEVYVARRQTDGRLYALKTIRRDKWEKLDSRTRPRFIGSFRREVWIWVTLGKHPNIVQAHWFESLCCGKRTFQYLPFLVMEYVEGHPDYGNTVRSWLNEHPKFDIPLALDCCIQAITGLIHAQRVAMGEFDAQFVHHDLKPDNLLINKEGRVKVTDFGLAKVFGVTYEGGGTCYYMAPEQWQKGETDERTDIYAFGCIMYEFLTREAPFWGPSLEGIKQGHLNKTISVPHHTKRGEPVPSELQSLITECLAKGKEARPQRLLDLREALQKIQCQLSGNSVILKNETEGLEAEEWNQRGIAFDGLGKYEKALECYGHAIEIDPRAAKYHTDKGHSLYRIGKVDESIENYEKALRIDPRFARALVGLGHAYVAKKESLKAIECFNKAERIEPELPGLYIGRGMAYAFSEQYGRAMEEFKRAERLGRKAEAYVAMGNVELACYNDPEHARRCYEKAVEADPMCREAYNNLAKLYESLEMHQESEMCQTKADGLLSSLEIL
jgi:serine/threonine protein kinase